MNVLGHDTQMEAYRVSVEASGTRLVGLIPCHIMSAFSPLTGGHGHQTAYGWIARHQGRIEHALMALRDGRDGIPAPFDRMVLEEED